MPPPTPWRKRVQSAATRTRRISRLEKRARGHPLRQFAEKNHSRSPRKRPAGAPCHRTAHVDDGEKSFIGGHYRSEEFNTEPYNRYTIIRARFDKWFSEQAQNAGALVICEMTAKPCSRNESARLVTGVRASAKTEKSTPMR